MAGAALGYTYYLSRDEAKAQSILEQSLVLANELKSSYLSALIQDYLGMLYVSQHASSKALVSFNQALKNAELAKNVELIAGIQVNKVALEDDACNHINQLAALRLELLKITNQTVKVKLLLNVGEQLLALKPDTLKDSEKYQWLTTTYQTLNDAYILTEAGKQVRLKSQAEGYLGQLYAQQQRNQDALVWFDKALSDAQKF